MVDSRQLRQDASPVGFDVAVVGAVWIDVIEDICPDISSDYGRQVCSRRRERDSSPVDWATGTLVPLLRSSGNGRVHFCERHRGIEPDVILPQRYSLKEQKIG